MIASHSNSYAVCAHQRNIKDHHFKAVRNLGGVVGISLAPQHITLSERAFVSDICRHIMHYLSLDGEDTVCLGCDFDGIKKTPEGFFGVDSVILISDELLRLGVSDEKIEKIFFKNAMRFAGENIF